jgi:hypothetical protein
MPYSTPPVLIFLMLLGSLCVGSAAAQSTPPNTAFLIPDQVSTVLRARGYSELSSIVRDGDTFFIHTAVRYGEKVQNLRIDALSGQARDEQRLTEMQAKTLLRDRGYVDVTELGQDGNIVRLRAVRGGTPSELKVDLLTGAVRQ